MVTAADIQALIVDEVGDTDDTFLTTVPPGGSQLRIATYWDSYADKAAVYPRLQELYTKRRAIDGVLGHIRNQVDFVTPTLAVKLSQETDRLQAMKVAAQTEIDKLEATALANRAAVVGTMARTELVSPDDLSLVGAPPWRADANDPRFAGSPYTVRPERWR